jgi:hypothetical protein
MTSNQIKSTVCYIRLMNRKKAQEGLTQKDLDNLNLILDEVADTFPYKYRPPNLIGLGYEKETKTGDWIKRKLHEIIGL